jgi:hypothetical protein
MSLDNDHQNENDATADWAFRKFAEAGQIAVIPSPNVGRASGRSSKVGSSQNTPSSQDIMDQRGGYVQDTNSMRSRKGSFLLIKPYLTIAQVL